METETSQCTTLSLPPRLNPLDYIGCYVTLITYYGLRYVGIVYDLNIQEWKIVLQNVQCFGTEGRGKNGLHVRPSNEVFEWIKFDGKLVKSCLKAPLISNENLENPQATTDYEAFSVNYGPVHFASNPLTQAPQFPGVSYFVDPRSLPCGPLNQALIHNASYPQSLPYASLNQAPIYNASNLQYLPSSLLDQAPIDNASYPQYLPYGSLNEAPIYNASNPLFLPCDQASIDNASNPQYLPYSLLNQAPPYNASNPQSLRYTLINQAPIDNALNPQSLPYTLINQDSIDNASKPELMSTPTKPFRSFFSDPSSHPTLPFTYPTLPFSLPPLCGGSETENTYKIWGPFEDEIPSEDEIAPKPLDPIERRPYNQFGHIERPLDYCKVISDYIQRNPLLPYQPPFDFNQ